MQSAEHNNDIIMGMVASHITSLTIVYSIVLSGPDQRKHQNSLDCVREIHRWPVNSPQKGPVTRKTFPFHDIILKHMATWILWNKQEQCWQQQQRYMHILWKLHYITAEHITSPHWPSTAYHRTAVPSRWQMIGIKSDSKATFGAIWPPIRKQNIIREHIPYNI